MGALSTKCCCKEDLDAERLTDSSDQMQAKFVNLDHSKLYDAACTTETTGSFEGSMQSSVQQGNEDESDSFAPAPNDDRGGHINPIKTVEARQDKTEEPTYSSRSHDEPVKVFEEKVREPPRRQESEPAPSSTVKIDSAPHCVTDLPETTIDVKSEEMKNESKHKVYGYPGKMLEILLDDGWKEFAADDMQQINNHLKAGSDKFAITCRGAMYMIDFSDTTNITQTNPTTRKVRNLRLVNDSGLGQNKQSSSDPNKNSSEASSVYIVTHVSLPVSETVDRTSAEIAQIQKGALITVLEIAEKADEGRVRARIQSPAGWISAWMEDKSAFFIKKADDANQNGDIPPKQTGGKCCVIS